MAECCKQILLLGLIVSGLSLSLCAQRVAVIFPENDGELKAFDYRLRLDLRKTLRVIDNSLADSAFRSAEIGNPFNQTTDEARRVAAVVGCEYLVVLRSKVQRREAVQRPAYFEAYAFAFVVDGRSGRLIEFLLDSHEANTAADAETKLQNAAANLSAKIADAIRKYKIPTIGDARFTEVPPDGSPQIKNLRTPIPYRRIRPEYTRDAYLYGIAATVDIEVDIDTDGTIARTGIERWAGFGLDESVERTVRSMNWRPAERDGKALPMRVLLRYNFTKIEKDEAN